MKNEKPILGYRVPKEVKKEFEKEVERQLKDSKKSYGAVLSQIMRSWVDGNGYADTLREDSTHTTISTPLQALSNRNWLEKIYQDLNQLDRPVTSASEEDLREAVRTGSGVSDRRSVDKHIQKMRDAGLIKDEKFPEKGHFFVFRRDLVKKFFEKVGDYE